MSGELSPLSPGCPGSGRMDARHTPLKNVRLWFVVHNSGTSKVFFSIVHRLFVISEVEMYSSVLNLHPFVSTF